MFLEIPDEPIPIRDRTPGECETLEEKIEWLMYHPETTWPRAVEYEKQLDAYYRSRNPRLTKKDAPPCPWRKTLTDEELDEQARKYGFGTKEKMLEKATKNPPPALLKAMGLSE